MVFPGWPSSGVWSQATEQRRAARPVCDLTCSVLLATELFRLELGSVSLRLHVKLILI